MVACELMDEDNGRASAHFFVIEIHAVAGSDFRHCRVSTSWLRSDHNASQNEQAAPNAVRLTRDKPPGASGLIRLNSGVCLDKASACLSHPEGLVHLSMGIAARDADVAQSRIAQTIKLAS
jgi:hypothetical protein